LLLIKEDVGGFEVSMENDFAILFRTRTLATRLLLRLLVASMALEQSQCDLHEDAPDRIFLDSEPFLLVVVDKLREVSSSAVLHDNVECGVLSVHNLVETADNIFMT
jgi:hypothetical protein